MNPRLKIIYVGPFWKGSTAQHRLEAMMSLPNCQVDPLDTLERPRRASLVERICAKLQMPLDKTQVGSRLLQVASHEAHNVVFIDSVRTIRPSILAKIRRKTGCIAFYSPDDIIARHNSSWQIRRAYKTIDVFFTTKSFNVEELALAGVRMPRLVGNSFHPPVHKPMGGIEERFDVVLVGTYEAQRSETVSVLTKAGISVGVFGDGWPTKEQRRIKAYFSPAVYNEDYVVALHSGRIALCPLRSLNRDRITQRSVEIPGAGRPMVAQSSKEHDDAFVDGKEYLSYRSDEDAVLAVKALIGSAEYRTRLRFAGRLRTQTSGYSTFCRATEMTNVIRDTLVRRSTKISCA